MAVGQLTRRRNTMCLVAGETKLPLQPREYGKGGEGRRREEKGGTKRYAYQ